MIWITGHFNTNCVKNIFDSIWTHYSNFDIHFIIRRFQVQSIFWSGIKYFIHFLKLEKISFVGTYDIFTNPRREFDYLFDNLKRSTYSIIFYAPFFSKTLPYLGQQIFLPKGFQDIKYLSQKVRRTFPFVKKDKKFEKHWPNSTVASIYGCWSHNRPERIFWRDLKRSNFKPIFLHEIQSKNKTD